MENLIMSSFFFTRLILALELGFLSFPAAAHPIAEPQRPIKADGIYVADVFESLYNDPSSLDEYEFYSLIKAVEIHKEDVLGSQSFQVSPEASGALTIRVKLPLLRNLDKDLATIRFVNATSKKRSILLPLELKNIAIQFSSVDSRIISGSIISPKDGSSEDFYTLDLLLTKEGQTRWKTLAERNLPLLSNAVLKLSVNLSTNAGDVDRIFEIPFSIQSLPTLDFAFDSKANLELQGSKRGKLHYWEQFRSCNALALGQLMAPPTAAQLRLSSVLTAGEQQQYEKAAQDGFLLTQKEQAFECQQLRDEEAASTYWKQYLGAHRISCSTVETLEDWPLVYFDVRLQSERFIKKVNELYDAFKRDCEAPLDVVSFDQHFDSNGCFTGGLLSFSEPVTFSSFDARVEIRVSAAPGFNAREFTLGPGPLPTQINLKSTFIPICRREFDLFAVLKGVEATSGRKLLQDSVHVIEYP
jgi:hypothetical protein